MMAPLPPAKAGLREGTGSDGRRGLVCSFLRVTCGNVWYMYLIWATYLRISCARYGGQQEGKGRGGCLGREQVGCAPALMLVVAVGFGTFNE